MTEHVGPGIREANPGTDVVADLLVTASEESAERLVEADRLLRRLVGDDVVQEGHRIWTARLREGINRPESTTSAPSREVFDLTRRVRAGTSRGRW